MNEPVTPPPTLPELPQTPPLSSLLATWSTATPSPATSATATEITTPPSSPNSSLQTSPFTCPSSPATPTNLTLPNSQTSLPNPTSPLLSLPPELQLQIISHLQDTHPVTLLALRSAHPLFAVLSPTSVISWKWIPLRYRRAEYVTAERSFREGHLRGLWASGLMPCYSCMHLKGKSCFSVDVREGNRGIGAEGFEWRRCVLCGGSDKREARRYMREIRSVWQKVA